MTIGYRLAMTGNDLLTPLAIILPSGNDLPPGYDYLLLLVGYDYWAMIIYV